MWDQDKGKNNAYLLKKITSRYFFQNFLPGAKIIVLFFFSSLRPNFASFYSKVEAYVAPSLLNIDPL